MKKINLTLAAALATSMLVAPAAIAQRHYGTNPVILEVLGQRGWEVSCRMTQSDGDIVTSRERGRGLHDNGRIMVANVASGTCSYSVPERGELRVTMETRRSGMECPFSETADGICRAYFPAGAEGAFTIQPSAPAAPATGS